MLQLVEEREGCYKIRALVQWFLQKELADANEMKWRKSLEYNSFDF
ncbi:hypothetical protein [Nostoc sp.]